MNIIKAFENVKRDYPFHVVLKNIRGKYYVYKDHGVWLKDKAKTKIISEYLGRITEDGFYIKKTFSAKDDLENAKAIIASRGGEIIWHEKLEEEKLQVVKHDLTIKDIDLKLLTALSMNSRMSASKLAKIVGINKQTVYYKIKSLEKDLDIKYIMEIDVGKLGYTTYLLMIKFETTVPTAEDLKSSLSKEPKVQFAATTKGEYDLVVSLLDEDPIKTEDTIWNLRAETALGKYKAIWRLVPVGQVYSFIPLRNAFFENLLIKKEWHRTKESQNPKQDELKHREFILLKELNENSSKSFTDIEKKNDLINGAAKYAYDTLKQKGVIIRPTITIKNLPFKYIGILMLELHDITEALKARHALLYDMIEYGTVANKYALVGNVGNPEGSISFFPAEKDGDFEDARRFLETEAKGEILKTLIITEILVGYLCYRRFDGNYSRQQRMLINMKKEEPKQLTDYS